MSIFMRYLLYGNNIFEFFTLNSMGISSEILQTSGMHICILIVMSIFYEAPQIDDALCNIIYIRFFVYFQH